MSDVKITVGGNMEDDAVAPVLRGMASCRAGKTFHERHVAFESWDALARVLTGKRMELLRYVHRHSLTSIRALAKALGRDYSNVHADVQALAAAGLLDSPFESFSTAVTPSQPRKASGRITMQSKRGSRSRPASYATVSRTLNSSFQRRPSRATHQSCRIPVSVITVSNDTGTTSASRAVGRELHFHGRQLFEIVAEILDQCAGRIALAVAEQKKRNSAGSSTMRPNSRSGMRASVPSSMPN